MPLSQLLSFRALTCHSLCGLQEVSLLSSVAFVLCPENSSCGVLQEVSALRSVAFLPYPDKFLPLWSLVCECSVDLLGGFLLVI